ncbi:MAG TPA: hypothetical protein VF789_02230 [Thermoanaerobaculia bacterium]
MTSTRIHLPEKLMELAESSAESMGISLDELVRESLELRLSRIGVSWENDPFLSDREVYDGPTPPDLVENLDDYLYGSKD